MSRESTFNKPANFFSYLILVHLGALAVFAAYRLLLFLTVDYSFPPHIASDTALQAKAFLIGVWFDNVMACYILLLPLVIFWICTIFDCSSKWLFRLFNFWFIVLYGVAFLASAANVPYFEYFFKTINSSIFEWFSYGTQTVGMVTGESAYLKALLIYLAALLLFALYVCGISSFFCGRIEKSKRVSIHNFAEKRSIVSIFSILILGAAVVGACVFGIRGRVGYNPIRVSAAYYCSDPFLNQLGLNPAFNILQSWNDDNRSENRKLQLMDDAKAIAMAAEYRHAADSLAADTLSSSILKDSTLNAYYGVPGAFRGKNVVVIFLESMSANLMGAFGNNAGLTPNIDSFWRHSLHFTNFWSAGIHTNHGMYSTLYSFPAIMQRNAMKGSVIPRYSGLPTELKRMGYRNLFFMTHESQYDNMNAFFKTNGFDEIYSQENYPKSEVVNSFGVQDHYLFSYALPVLDIKAQEGAPFFAVLLTVSNHPPYILPDWFKPRSGKIEDAIVEYADAAVGKFFEQARGKSWYENTIFVLLGDHGKLIGTPDCEVPSSYNHVPMMIYGYGVEPGELDMYCGQIDVAPTLLGMLGAEWTNIGYGVDILHQKRPGIFYGSDNMIAARADGKLYIYSPESGLEYFYTCDSLGNLTAATATAAASDTDTAAGDSLCHAAGTFADLKRWCFAMFQSAECVVREGKTVVDYAERGEQGL